MPLSGSRRQKSGEGAKYTRSRVAGGFTWGSRGRRAVREPTRVRRTWVEMTSLINYSLTVMRSHLDRSLPLWLRQSVLSTQHQPGETEAWPSNRFWAHMIQKHRDTCTPPACYEGSPERGTRKPWKPKHTDCLISASEKHLAFRPASLLWMFISGRPSDMPFALSGSSTKFWENATPYDRLSEQPDHWKPGGGTRDGCTHVFPMWICYYVVFVLTFWADPSDLTVTATSFQLSPATASGHSHSYSGRWKSVDKCCLTGT